MTAATRSNILNHLSQVNHNSFAGYSIRTFVLSAHLKTDDEVIQCVSEIKQQIIDNRAAMKTVLGSKYDFFNNLKLQPNACLQS